MGRAIVMRSEKGEKAAKAAEPKDGSGRRREAAGIILLSLALFLLLSTGSLALGDGKLMGPVGLWVATATYALLGIGSLLCIYGLLALAVRCLQAAPLQIRVVGTAGLLGAGLCGAMLLHLLLGNYRLHGMPPGGAIGEYGAEMTKALLGTAGTALLCVAGLLLSLLGATSLSFRALFSHVGRVTGGTLGLLGEGVRSLFPASGDDDEDEDEEEQKDAKRKAEAAPEGRKRRSREGAVEGVPIVAIPAGAAGAAGAPGAKDQPVIQKREPGPQVKETLAEQAPPQPVIAQRPDSARAKDRADGGQAPTPTIVPPVIPPPVSTPAQPANVIDEDEEPAPAPAPPVTVEAKGRRRKPAVEQAAEPPQIAPPARARKPAAPPPPAVKAPPPQALEVDDDEEDEDEVRGTPTIVELRNGAAQDLSDGDADPGPDEDEDDIEEEEAPAPKVVPPAPRGKQAAAPSPAAAPVIEAMRPSKPPPPKAEYIKLVGDYQLPSLDMLDYQEQGQGDLDRQAMLELAQRLEKTLADYQVRGRVSEIHPGPVVTMYEFVPAPGIKLSKITALSNDLAMALEALRVRIVAPIPGKAAVGIEVPNKTRETVYIKEILADDCFTKAKSRLTMGLGKDIAGNPVCVDLAKMPHLLVAGTTGSGKSVAVNGMVSSLLFNASPDDVKMIMIDPKMLELSIYEGIPHLLLPVVTDPKKANLALKWAVDEMERRYDLISKSGVRDIAGYNKKVEKILEERPHLQAKPRTLTIQVEGADGLLHDVQVMPSEEAVIAAGGVVTEEIRAEISDAVAENEALKERLAKEDPPRKLPYIVVLIDEFADLMMVAGKEVEMSVARIAQKARAAGIHLILATQRPSVDVITGLIKANFPSRIAFQVASRIDSRTILDAQGAENLLGMGDMLLMDRGQAVRRVHGALITDTEVHKVVEHLKKQGQPIYDMEILKPRGDEEEGEVEEDMSDEMYDMAARLVIETRQASISMVQRRLRIGYNRAARMIERMEREGLVSAADGAKGREVLVNSLP
jgi:S-DNA-T family DNA segregation ATPase FtsK/SpoIIIE